MAANQDYLIRQTTIHASPQKPNQRFITEATRGSTHQNISHKEGPANQWSSPDVYQSPDNRHQQYKTPSPFDLGSAVNPDYASPLRKVKKVDSAYASPDYKLNKASRDSDIIEGSYQ